MLHLIKLSMTSHACLGRTHLQEAVIRGKESKAKQFARERGNEAPVRAKGKPSEDCGWNQGRERRKGACQCHYRRQGAGQNEKDGPRDAPFVLQGFWPIPVWHSQ